MDDPMDESIPFHGASLINRFPYASRLGSNDPPSDDEMKEIAAFLNQSTEQVQQMEDEISSLQARLDSLRQRHAALKEEVESCRSLMAITRRLPEDILLEIFFQCLPATCNPTINSTAAAPLLLTSVCRRWRILALQTSTLWSSMHISIKDVENKGYMSRRNIDALRYTSQQNFQCMLYHWVALSGNCPITISFSIDFDNDRVDKFARKSFENCLRILLPSISRWKSVFFAGNVKYLATLFTMPASVFQLLESLFLEINLIPQSTIPIFSAPSLRKVSIRTNIFYSTTCALPWARLTHLDLGGTVASNAIPQVVSLSTSLNLCTSLVYLGLVICWRDIIKPVHLPNLRRIFIRQHGTSQDANGPGLFSENLNAPSLKYISLRNFDDNSFPVFLSRHGRFIHTLDFNINSITLQTFADGIRHCPSLESLSIIRLPGDDKNHFNVNTKFLSLFIPITTQSDRSPLCPLLQQLTFDNITCETLTGLVSFLKAKQNSDPLVLSRLVRLSTDFIQDGFFGPGQEWLTDETIKLALKPFTDNNLMFKMLKGSRPYSYRMTSGWSIGSIGSLQHADCWRDSD